MSNDGALFMISRGECIIVIRPIMSVMYHIPDPDAKTGQDFSHSFSIYTIVGPPYDVLPE